MSCFYIWSYDNKSNSTHANTIALEVSIIHTHTYKQGYLIFCPFLIATTNVAVIINLIRLVQKAWKPIYMLSPSA